jgi:chromosome segregation ATPase
MPVILNGPPDYVRIRSLEQSHEIEGLRQQLISAQERLTSRHAERAAIEQQLSALRDYQRCAQNTIQHQQQQLDLAVRNASALERDLLQARRTIQHLQQELDAGWQRSGSSIFRRVGLDEKCPDFVMKAARKAYRVELHPDRRPDSQKAEAENRFKEAEAVFDEIYRLRHLN